MSESYLDYADNRGPGRPMKYPLAHIALGDCMFFAGATSNLIHSRAFEYKPMKFRARAMVIRGIPGVMVWRIA